MRPIYKKALLALIGIILAAILIALTEPSNAGEVILFLYGYGLGLECASCPTCEPLPPHTK